MLKIYACIWSNDKAADMAKYYKSIFKGTKVDKWNTSKNKKKKEAVMHAMWNMVKLDRNKLKEAFDRA